MCFLVLNCFYSLFINILHARLICVIKFYLQARGINLTDLLIINRNEAIKIFNLVQELYWNTLNTGKIKTNQIIHNKPS